MLETPSTDSPSARVRTGLRIGVAIGVLACVALMAFLYFGNSAAQSRVRAIGVGPPSPPGAGRGFGGGRGGFGGGGVQQDRKLVAQFDTDADGRLNAAERDAARDVLAGQGRGAAPGRRGGGGFNRAKVDAPPGVRLTPAGVRVYGDESLYDTTVLRTVFLQFERANWEDELTSFYRTDVDVPAVMTVDGKTYRDVGVHFRGNSSFRMVPQGLKHSFKLSIDAVHADQTLGGYRTVDLLNANQDPTFLRSVLYSEVARSYLAAPKANFMRVVINGESWGIYANQQAFNKDFLRDWFQTTTGARWKVPGNPRGRGGLDYLGGSISAYKAIYEIKSKDDTKSWNDLIHLCQVLNETPAARLEAALAPILDVDGALKFLALDNALIDNDGYWTRASDYSIYEDPGGRFHIIPHDFNETFNDVERGRGFGQGRGGASVSGVELDPLIGLDDDTKPLRSKLLAVPALRTRYLGYVRDIAERWLDWKTLGPIARRYQALIADSVEHDTHKIYAFDEFDAAAATDTSVKSFADRRRAFLLRELKK